MMDFTEKVFIVTGASSGIGLSRAGQIIALGGRVTGAGRRMPDDINRFRVLLCEAV